MLDSERFDELRTKYDMTTLIDEITGCKTGVFVYTDHEIDELNQLMLDSTTEQFPVLRNVFASNVIRYTIYAPESWL